MRDADQKPDPDPTPAAGGWLWVDPERLEKFADGVEELIPRLEALRTSQSDAAWFRGPSTDPATMNASARLAEDGYDVDGTPVRAIAKVINDLRQQVIAARLAARDHRANEQAAVEAAHAVAEAMDEPGGQGP
ncbi:MAG: hypothetical protein WBA97_17445 [Actinophytocola sp.]|uniref:hypothetical protein n=1 Tax=Actinophytocola sp. TaxID=1872138 RepID=UPI003C719DA7